MTIADICRAWDRPSYVHGDVPSTHTVTRRFREGDRAPETVEHVLMKFQPYLQRCANTFYPKHPDEAEEAYVDFVLAITKRPYLFNKDLETTTLRSFVFQSYRNKLRDVLKRKNRWLARASRAAERTLELCRLQKSSEQRAVERGPEFFGSGTFRGQPCVVMRRGETVPADMDIKEALRFVDDLADGLMAMKSNGYCHGDVKRINLCLFDGRAGILDLGSARCIVPDGSSEEVSYTPGYAAPELTDGVSAAPWFDVYGAAVTLNEILGQPALVVYSPAIRAGMDLRPGKCLPSAADFAAAMHGCYKEYRRQRTFSILTHVVTHSLVAALVAARFIFAHHTTTICLRRRDDMRTFRDREIQSQAEYICGEGCKALGDLSKAVYFLERALKNGYRAK